jgi:hypothetical protein
VGLFDIFLPLTPIAAAETLRDAALSLDVTRIEEEIANGIGAELHILVKERILFRIGFTEASVGFFYSDNPHPRIEEMGDHLSKLFSQYMFSRPGVPKEVAAQLYVRAQREYILTQPNEMAARMLTNIHNGELRALDPQVQLKFLELVHGYAKTSMVLAGELAKKLREYKR